MDRFDHASRGTSQTIHQAVCGALRLFFMDVTAPRRAPKHSSFRSEFLLDLEDFDASMNANFLEALASSLLWL